MPRAGYECECFPLKAAGQSRTEGRNVALTKPDAPDYSPLHTWSLLPSLTPQART